MLTFLAIVATAALCGFFGGMLGAAFAIAAERESAKQALRQQQDGCDGG